MLTLKLLISGLATCITTIGCGTISHEYRLTHSFVEQFQPYYKADLYDVVINDQASVLYTFTMGNTINLAAGIKHDLNNRKHIQLLLHELVHIDQYAELGTSEFLQDYIYDSVDNNLIHDDLMFETEARNLEYWIMDEVFGEHFEPKD